MTHEDCLAVPNIQEYHTTYPEYLSFIFGKIEPRRSNLLGQHLNTKQVEMAASAGDVYLIQGKG